MKYFCAKCEDTGVFGDKGPGGMGGVHGNTIADICDCRYDNPVLAKNKDIDDVRQDLSRLGEKYMKLREEYLKSLARIKELEGKLHIESKPAEKSSLFADVFGGGSKDVAGFDFTDIFLGKNKKK